jgi:hypothetical protein
MKQWHADEEDRKPDSRGSETRLNHGGTEKAEEKAG